MPRQTETLPRTVTKRANGGWTTVRKRTGAESCTVSKPGEQWPGTVSKRSDGAHRQQTATRPAHRHETAPRAPHRRQTAGARGSATESKEHGGATPGEPEALQPVPIAAHRCR